LNWYGNNSLSQKYAKQNEVKIKGSKNTLFYILKKKRSWNQDEIILNLVPSISFSSHYQFGVLKNKSM